MPTKVVLIVEQLVRLANRHPSVFGYIKEESGGTEKGKDADQLRLTMGYALYRLIIDQRDFDSRCTPMVR